MVVICIANAGVHCDADAVALAAATTAAEQTISKEQRGAAKTLTAMLQQWVPCSRAYPDGGGCWIDDNGAIG